MANRKLTETIKSGRAAVRMLAAGLAVSAIAAPAGAHHSFARFDSAHPATLSGTLKDFVWSNPHSWIHLYVPNGSGGNDVWTLEGPPVNTLFRTGWRYDMVKPGMKIKLLILVARAGTGNHDGAFQRLLEVDGKPTTVGTAPNQGLND